MDAIAGGGGLISLPAYIFAGLPMYTAIATNKLSSSMGTTVAAIQYIRKGYMKRAICLPSIAFAICGSNIGAHLNIFLPEQILKIIILCVLPFLAVYVFRKDSLNSVGHDAYGSGKTVFLCALSSFGVGIYDGLYGPGTGTVLMLLFTGFCHLSLEDAAGTAKAVNLTTNFTALAVFLINVQLLILLGLIAGAFNMAGNYLGSRCFTSRGAKITRPVILVVLAVFFIKIIVELIPA